MALAMRLRSALLLILSVLLWFPAPAAASSVYELSSTHGQEAGPGEERANSRPPFPSRKPTLDLPRLYASDRQATTTTHRPTRGTGLVQDDDPIQLIDEARANGEKWIEVILSEQKLIAWEGNQRLREFIISSGVAGHETVRGTFRMWVRTRTQTMSGGNRAAGTYYSLPNVEWVQYFYEDFALHGTYWHNNFGVPMSHGCVNMTNEDAEWLFLWAMPEYDGERGWLATSEANATLVHVRD